MNRVLIQSRGLSALTMTALGLLLLGAGCATTSPDREARMSEGYIFYCDGSGGGGKLMNYAQGVRKGLVDAGYKGSGEMFPWHTGLGFPADHTSSVAYKRGKAKQLARRIEKYIDDHPGAPVTVMGLSAGSAIAVFSLEELSSKYKVDNAFLLSPSISANYDLTKALHRVRRRMYVFTSSNDAVLRHLVPLGGTADRQSGAPAGLDGFRRPHGGSSDTRAQYAKLTHIHWKHEYKLTGHGGGHTDVVAAGFVQEYIAPLVQDVPTRPLVAAATADKVRNPDYQRWATFAPGSWIRWQGYQEIGGRREPMFVKASLVEKQADKLIIRWQYFTDSGAQSRPVRVNEFIEPAWVAAEDSPLSHPETKVIKLGPKSLALRKQNLRCDVSEVVVGGDFEDWGRNIRATLYRSESVPGTIVSATLQSHKGSEPFEFHAELVDYYVAGE